MDKYFKRDNQYWKRKPDGSILLINTEKENDHYDGGSLFLDIKSFNEVRGEEISEKEFNIVRFNHMERINKF